MKSILYFGIILLSLFFSVCEKINAQSPKWLWAKAMGGPSDEFGASVAVDTESGEVYITGAFSETVDFDPGNETFNLTAIGGEDIFIAKLDGNGNLVWAKAMGGQYYEDGSSIAVDPAGSGDVYISGFFSGTVDFDPGVEIFYLTAGESSSIFISKLDRSGNFVWAKSIVGTDDGDVSVRSMAVDPSGSGDVYLTGYLEGAVDFDPSAETFNLTAAGCWDIFISKLDGSGNLVWAKTMSGTDCEQGRSIILDPAGSGNVYTTGFFDGTVDFDPGEGVFKLTSEGGRDIFISKLDTSGNFIWVKAMGSTGFGYGDGYSIAVNPSESGGVYTTGYFQGTVDFDPGEGTFNLTPAGNADIFISKLDDSGNFVWAKSMGGTLSGFGTSITVDPSGGEGVYTTGWFHGTVDFDPGLETFNLTAVDAISDVFISKLDGSGNFEWAKSFGGTRSDFCQSISLDASNHVFVAGHFYSPSI